MPDLVPIGAAAPAFELQGTGKEGGVRVRLHDLRGAKNVVLVFYPGDDTPG